MNPITPKLTNYLEQHYKGKNKVAQGLPYFVNTYNELVKIVAELSYLNKEQLLFFRGQHLDFKNKKGNSTFYPSIYRGEHVSKDELKDKFESLDNCCHQLCNMFSKKDIDTYPELFRKKYIQWSILQHYEVCDTPLLDLTQSLRVAVSFALNKNMYDYGYVYVFGLPYLTNRISINSEQDIVNVRLLSICPPKALRPYYQEGYMVGTTDITSDYLYKSELDFKRRLIAKFKIPKNKFFNKNNIATIDHNELFPENDEILETCKQINTYTISNFNTTDETNGKFLRYWNELELFLQERAYRHGIKSRNISKLLKLLKLNNAINVEDFEEIMSLRGLRNDVVHKVNSATKKDVESGINRLSSILNKFSTI